jgi:hypothetical protein
VALKYYAAFIIPITATPKPRIQQFAKQESLEEQELYPVYPSGSHLPPLSTITPLN